MPLNSIHSFILILWCFCLSHYLQCTKLQCLARTCHHYTPPQRSYGGYTGIRLSVRPSVCPSVCPSVRPSVCLSVRRHNFVRPSSSTVLLQFCWNFVSSLMTMGTCAPGIFVIVQLLIQELFPLVCFFWLICLFLVTPPTVFIQLTWNLVDALLVRCRCACGFCFQVWQL